MSKLLSLIDFEGVKSLVLGILLIGIVAPFVLLGVRVCAFAMSYNDIEEATVYAGPGGSSPGSGSLSSGTPYYSLTHSNDKLSDIFKDFKLYFNAPSTIGTKIITKYTYTVTTLGEYCSIVSDDLYQYLKGLLGFDD